MDFYPYYDFYAFLQNKKTYLKDIDTDIKIFVTNENKVYFITPKDSYVEYTIFYDTERYIDEAIYEK